MESGLDALREQIVRRLQQTSEELLGLVEQHQLEEKQTPVAPAEDGLRPLRAAIASLDGADSQAEILARLLEVSSSFATRSALLLKSDAGLKVWSSTGFDESHEGRELGAFDEDRWVEACSGRGATRLDGRACARLAEALEADLPSQGAVIPLVLRDEVPAVLYADTDNGSSPNLEALQLLTYAAAQCLETLPLRSERPVSTLVALEAEPDTEEDTAADDMAADDMADANAAPDVASEGWGSAAALGAAAAGTAAAALTTDSPASEEQADSDDDSEDDGPEPEAATSDELEAAPLEDTQAIDETVLEETDADDETSSSELEAADSAEPVIAEPDLPTLNDESDHEEDEAEHEAASAEAVDPAVEADEDEEPPLSAETRRVPTMDLPDPDLEDPDLPDHDLPDHDLADGEVEQDRDAEGPSVFGIAQKAGAAAGAAALAAGSRLWGGSEDDDASEDERDVEEPAAGDPLSALQTDAPPEPASRSVYDEMGALDPPESPSSDPISSLETQVIRTGDLPSGPAEPAAPRVFGPPPPVTPPPADPPAVPAPPPAPDSESAASTNQVMPPEDVHEGPGWAFTGSSTDEPAGAATAEGPLHEEARRLARLLVSEIKLYNEEQIEEGRRQGNIYEQLRDDIDRSKRMYEERIDQTVRQSTDYFRDELVRSLADGDAQVLGL